MTSPEGRPGGAPSCIAILTAMPMELKPVVKRLGLTESRRGGRTLRTGTVGSTEVVATYTGMGPDNARRVTTEVLDITDAGQVIVIGIAGGVDPALAIGDVVVPEVVVDRDTGRQFHSTALPGTTPKGLIVTGEGLSLGPELPDEIKALGITAVDMETSAMAEVAESRGRPWCAFRSISDRESDGLVDDEVFHLSAMDGSPDLKAVTRFVAKHPGKVPTLVRLARDSYKATAAAAEAGVRACRALAASS
jgi:adenosylhomocysteine nucleosidase